MPILQVEIEQRHHTISIMKIIDFIMIIGYYCFYFDPRYFELKKLECDPITLQKSENFNTISYINNFYFLIKNQSSLTMVKDINVNLKLRKV